MWNIDFFLHHVSYSTLRETQRDAAKPENDGACGKGTFSLAKAPRRVTRDVIYERALSIRIAEFLRCPTENVAGQHVRKAVRASLTEAEPRKWQ